MVARGLANKSFVVSCARTRVVSSSPTWSDFRATAAWCTITKPTVVYARRSRNRTGFTIGFFCASAVAQRHIIDERYTANFADTCYCDASGNAKAVYGFTGINLAPFFRFARNAPNLAVNYGGAFSARTRATFKYSTIGPFAPPMHFYAADYLFPPSLALAEFSVTPSLPRRPPAALSTNREQIGRVDGSTDIFIALLSCSYALLLLFTASFLSTPSTLLPLMCAERKLW